MQNSLVQSSVASGMITTLALFQDTVSNLERICNTPLPFAYQAHLRLSLWFVFDYSVFHSTSYWLRFQDISYPTTSMPIPIKFAGPCLTRRTSSKSIPLTGLLQFLQQLSLHFCFSDFWKSVRRCELFLQFPLVSYMNLMLQRKPIRLRLQWSWYAVFSHLSIVLCSIRRQTLTISVFLFKGISIKSPPYVPLLNYVAFTLSSTVHES